jgi:hypothetical protein
MENTPQEQLQYLIDDASHNKFCHCCSLRLLITGTLVITVLFSSVGIMIVLFLYSSLTTEALVQDIGVEIRLGVVATTYGLIQKPISVLSTYRSLFLEPSLNMTTKEQLTVITRSLVEPSFSGLYAGFENDNFLGFDSYSDVRLFFFFLANRIQTNHVHTIIADTIMDLVLLAITATQIFHAIQPLTLIWNLTRRNVHGTR